MALPRSSSMWRLILSVLLSTGLGSAELINTNTATPETAPLTPEDVPFTTTITVLNPHARAVKVKNIDSSCTCTTLVLADHFLLPKSITTLNVVIDNHNHSGAKRVVITIYPTDPELEAIEVVALWTIIPVLTVDAIPPGGSVTERPDWSYQDVYRYVSSERPDETNRLRKRFRLMSSADTMPADGLKILGIDYDGPVWRFTPVTQADGSILVTAVAKDPAPVAGRYDETVVIRTNHQRKPRIELFFNTQLSMDVGKRVGVPVIPGM